MWKIFQVKKHPDVFPPATKVKIRAGFPPAESTSLASKGLGQQPAQDEDGCSGVLVRLSCCF